MFVFGSVFRTFFEVLKLFKCLLGAFLNLLCSSWEASGKQKVFQGFCKCSFLGLWSSQWPPWTQLRSFLARSGPKTVPKMAPQSTQKWSKNKSKKLPPKSWILRRFWAPIWDHFGVKWPLKLNLANLPGPSGQPMGPKNLLKTCNCRQNQVLALKSFQTDLKILTWSGTKTWNRRPNQVKNFQTDLKILTWNG